MTFALDNNPSQSQISEAINYLLANFGPNLSADPNTGQITGPGGVVIAYLYRYLAVKYADSFDGSLNFSNTPTNRGYYGVSNSNSTTESTNFADYLWFKVAGGFGTTKFLFYQCTGGRSINFVVATTAPNNSYIQDSGIAIDLDVITTGASANSATTAYLVQSQSSPAPTGFPLYTFGNTLPSGWSSTIGTVAVGQVVWYSFGQYNGSTVAVNGIPADSTYWSTPVAASVFQDIRSDNWNGSTPPTYGSPGTYGTQGYYISRTTGDVYFNNGIFRANINTSGDAVFNGDNTTTATIPVYDSLYYIDYSTLGNGTTTASLGNARAGLLGTAVSSGSVWNAGVIGYGVIPSGVSGGVGIGVVGSSNDIGGYFSSYLNSGVGLVCNAASTTSRAFQINQGRFAWGSYTIAQPTGSTTTFLRNDGQWTTVDAVSLGGFAATSWARIFVGDSGTANAGGSGMNFNCTISGYQFAGSGNTLTLQPISDRRLKENIAPETLGLSFVNSLIPVTYSLIGQQRKSHGFIAQDIETLIADANDSLKIENADGMKGVDYMSLIAPLVKAIQELSAEVEALKAQLKV